MSYEHLTFMLSLPRSRSAWMAEFLRPLCVSSMHNPLQQCASIAELGQKIDKQPSGRVFVSDVAGLYDGRELQPYTGRPGAMDAYALPSIHNGQRVERLVVR